MLFIIYDIMSMINNRHVLVDKMQSLNIKEIPTWPHRLIHRPHILIHRPYRLIHFPLAHNV